jgi:hypothetical protein
VWRVLQLLEKVSVQSTRLGSYAQQSVVWESESRLIVVETVWTSIDSAPGDIPFRVAVRALDTLTESSKAVIQTIRDQLRSM